MSTFKKDLEKQQYFIIERNPNNPYLNLSGLDSVVGSGLNSFFILGSQYLERDTEVLFEVVDTVGYTTEIAGVKNLLRGNSRVVSFEIDKDVSDGGATLYIAAELKTYVNSSGNIVQIPQQWKGRYNILFVYQFTVDKNRANSDDVIFRKTPVVDITPSIKPIINIKKQKNVIGNDFVTGFYQTDNKGNVTELPIKKFDGTINDSIISGSSLITVGDFDSLNETDVDNITSFDLVSGSIILSDMPEFDGTINTVDYNETFNRVIVTGEFTTVGGYTYSQIALLNPDRQQVDLSFQSIETDGTILGAKFIDENYILIHGNFNQINGLTYSGSAVLDTFGIVDESYSNLSVSGSLTDVVIDSGSSFIFVGDISGSDSNIIKTNSSFTEQVWTSVEVNGKINTIHSSSIGYFIGGEFTTPHSASFLLNSDGTLNTDYQPVSMSGYVNDIQYYVTASTTQSIILGGDFDISGSDISNLVSLDYTGSIISDFNTPTVNEVNHITNIGDNFFIGGDFSFKDVTDVRTGNIKNVRSVDRRTFEVDFYADTPTFISELLDEKLILVSRGILGTDDRFSFVTYDKYPTERGFEGTITKIISSTHVKARFTNPDLDLFSERGNYSFPTVFLPDNVDFEFQCEYTTIPENLEEYLQESAYVNFKISDMQTVSGDVEYVRVSSKSDSLSETNYNVNYEARLDLQKSLLEIRDNFDVGILNTDEKVAAWDAKIAVNSTASFTGSEPQFVRNDEVLVGGAWITGSVVSPIVSSSVNGRELLEPIYSIQSPEFGALRKDTKYSIRLDAAVRNVEHDDTRLDVYVSGSGLPEGCSNRFGTLVHSFRTNSDIEWLDIFDIIYERDVTVTSGSLVFVTTGGDWYLRDIKIAPKMEQGFSPFEYRGGFPITVLRQNQDFDFKIEFFDGNGVRVRDIIYVDNVNIRRPNIVIEGGNNYISGSLRFGGGAPLNAEIQGSTLSSKGYEGFNETLQGAPAGFLMWSGSVRTPLTEYNGVGFELVASDGNYFRFGTDPSELDIRTEKFFVGDINSQFISASDGYIEISSSFYHLNPRDGVMILNGGTIKSSNDVTMDEGTGFYIGGDGSFKLGDEFQNIKFKPNEALELNNVDLIINNTGTNRPYEPALAKRFVWQSGSNDSIEFLSYEDNTYVTKFQIINGVEQLPSWSVGIANAYTTSSFIGNNENSFILDSDRPISVKVSDGEYLEVPLTYASKEFYYYTIEDIEFGFYSPFNPTPTVVVASSVNNIGTFSGNSNIVPANRYVKITSSDPVVAYAIGNTIKQAIIPASKEILYPPKNAIPINPSETSVIYGDGGVVIGGRFNTYNGISRDSFVSVDVSGSFDSASYNPDIGNGDVYDMIVDEDDRIIIFGDFKDVNNADYSGSARILSNGFVDFSYEDPKINGRVYSAERLADDKYFIVGDFTKIGNFETTGTGVLEKNGKRFNSYTPPNLDIALVRDVLPTDDGNVIIVGNFTEVDGFPYSGICAVNPNGNGLISTLRNPAFNTTLGLFAVAELTNGDLLVGGDITENGTQVGIKKIQKNGRILDFSLQLDGIVTHIEVIDNNDIIVGGEFTQKLIRIDSAGSILANYFSEVGVELIRGIDVNSDGNTYVSISNKVIRINSSGVVDSNFTTNIFNPYVVKELTSNYPTNGYYKGTEPFQVVDTRYGSMGMPIEALGDTYMVQDTFEIELMSISDNTTISVYSASYASESMESLKELETSFDHSLASRENSLKVTYTLDSTSNYLIEGSNRFALVSKTSNDLILQGIGFRKSNRSLYNNSTTISGDLIRTGRIQSNNWAGDKKDTLQGGESYGNVMARRTGSLIDLNNASMYLGSGLEWDGVNNVLYIRGAIQFTEANEPVINYVLRGIWDDNTIYIKNDLVQYEYEGVLNTYAAIIDHTSSIDIEATASFPEGLFGSEIPGTVWGPPPEPDASKNQPVAWTPFSKGVSLFRGGSLTSTQLFIEYDENGRNPNTTEVGVTMSIQNFVDPWFRFVTNEPSSFATESVFTDGSSSTADTASWVVPGTFWEWDGPVTVTAFVSENQLGQDNQEPKFFDSLTITPIKPGGNATPYYQIIPLNGTQIKNSNPDVQLEFACKVWTTGSDFEITDTDTRFTNIYLSTDYEGTITPLGSNVFDGKVINGSFSARRDQNPIIGRSFITGSQILGLYSGSNGIQNPSVDRLLDTIPILDVTDGLGGGSFIIPPEGGLTTIWQPAPSNQPASNGTYSILKMPITASFFDLQGREYQQAFLFEPSRILINSGTVDTKTDIFTATLGDKFEYDVDGNPVTPRADWPIIFEVNDGDGVAYDFSVDGIDSKTTTDADIIAIFTDPDAIPTKSFRITETLVIDSDGVDGLPAIYVGNENNNHGFTANDIGVVQSYAGSGTRLSVQEGVDILEYDNNYGSLTPLENNYGKYRINIESTNITSGVLSWDGTEFVVVSDHSAMIDAETEASIKYSITGSRQNGVPFKISTIQSFTKAFAGSAAKSLVLSTTSDIFNLSRDYQITPDSIVITANSNNIGNGTITWITRDLDGNIISNVGTVVGNKYTITAIQAENRWANLVGAITSDFPFSVTATQNYRGVDYEDTVTIFMLEEGSSNILVSLSNPSVQITSDADGTVSSPTAYDNSGTTITVREGVDILNYNGTATTDSNLASGEWRLVSIVDTNITVSSTRIDQGSTLLIGNHSNFDQNDDTAVVTYTLSVKNKLGRVSTYTATQNIAKVRQGILGPGIVYRGRYDASATYYYTDDRRDVVSTSDTEFWAVNDKTTGTTGSALGTPSNTNNNWLKLSFYESVATDILLARDATITRGLVIGTDGSTNGFIRSVGMESVNPSTSTDTENGYYFTNSGEMRIGADGSYLYFNPRSGLQLHNVDITQTSTDTMNVSNYLISKRVVMTTSSTIVMMATDPNTEITLQDLDGNFRGKYTMVNQFTAVNAHTALNGSSAIPAGFIIDSNKPLAVFDTSRVIDLPSVKMASKNYYFYNTTTTRTLRVYSPYETATVHIYEKTSLTDTTWNLRNNQVISKRIVGTITVSTSADWFWITSESPILVYDDTSGADMMLYPPSTKFINGKGSTSSITWVNPRTQSNFNATVNSYTAEATNPTQFTDRSDNTQLLPRFMQSDTYLIPSSTSGHFFRVIVTERTNGISPIISYATVNSSGVGTKQYVSVASVDMDDDVSVGTFNGSSSPLIVQGNVRFALYDTTDNRFVFGYDSITRGEYVPTDIITAEMIKAGKLQSLNWPSIGSEFNLNDGTFKLGGSSDPKLSWDGSILTIKGAIRQTSDGRTLTDYVNRGDWVASRLYYVNDLVQHESNGLTSTYACNTQHTSTAGTGATGQPQQSSYWDVYASSATGQEGASVNFIFRRSATNPGAPADSAGVPPNWSDSPPSGTDTLWASKGTKAVGATVFDWGNPYQIEGTAVAEITIYRKNSNTLSNNGSYNFTNNTLTPPTGWSLTAPSISADGEIVYGRTALITGAPTATSVVPTWSAAFIYAQRTDGQPGDNAKNVTLTADNQAFKTNELGVTSPTQIVFTAVRQNITSAVTWSTSPTVTLTGTGGTRTLTFANFGSNDSVTVTATADGISDRITVYRLMDGVDAYTVFLTNETHTFPASSGGVVNSSDFAAGAFTVKFFKGTTEYSIDNSTPYSSNTFRISSFTDDNIGGNFSGATYTPNAISSVNDTGYVDATIIDNSNGATFNKRYTFSKSKAGTDGQDGQDGGPGPGVVYRGVYTAGEFYIYTSERRDVVSVGGNYYLFNKPTSNTGTSSHTAPASADWISFGANFSSVATDILLAQEASITDTLTIGKFGTSEQGVLRSATATSLSAGDGFWLDNNGNFRVGNPSGNNILFDSSGTLSISSENVNITGSVNATGGKVGGWNINETALNSVGGSVFLNSINSSISLNDGSNRLILRTGNLTQTATTVGVAPGNFSNLSRGYSLSTFTSFPTERTTNLGSSFTFTTAETYNGSINIGNTTLSIINTTFPDLFSGKIFASLSLVLENTTTNQIVWSYNLGLIIFSGFNTTDFSNPPTIPISVTPSSTTHNYRFKTKVFIDGSIFNGTCSVGIGTDFAGFDFEVNLDIIELTTSGLNISHDTANGVIIRKQTAPQLTVRGSQIIQSDGNYIGAGLEIENTDTTSPGLWNIFQQGSLQSWRLEFYTSGASSGTKGFVSRAPAGAVQMNFTGQHRSSFTSSSIVDISDYETVGKIVVATGEYQNMDIDISSSIPTVNEALPIIEFSNTSYDKKVFGVLSDATDLNELGERTFGIGAFVSVLPTGSSEILHNVINSIGEGGIWVCNQSGSLENGDYITTSDIPGLGMKQNDDILHNYTVAKITQDCDFSVSSSYIEFDYSGSTYRKQFVGCTYHCG